MRKLLGVAVALAAVVGCGAVQAQGQPAAPAAVEAPKATLGLTVQRMSGMLPQYEVATVEPGGPADRAGLRPGDKLTAAYKAPRTALSLPKLLGGQEDIDGWLARQTPGAIFTLTYYRGAEARQTDVVLGQGGAKPQQQLASAYDQLCKPGAAQASAATCAALKADAAKAAAAAPTTQAAAAAAEPDLTTGLHFTAETDLTIRYVDPYGPAQIAGVARGDRLTKIGGKPVKTLADVRAALANKAAGDKIALESMRKGAVWRGALVMEPRPTDLYAAADQKIGKGDKRAFLIGVRYDSHQVQLLAGTSYRLTVAGDPDFWFGISPGSAYGKWLTGGDSFAAPAVVFTPKKSGAYSLAVIGPVEKGSYSVKVEVLTEAMAARAAAEDRWGLLRRLADGTYCNTTNDGVRYCQSFYWTANGALESLRSNSNGDLFYDWTVSQGADGQLKAVSSRMADPKVYAGPTYASLNWDLGSIDFAFYDDGRLAEAHWRSEAEFSRGVLTRLTKQEADAYWNGWRRARAEAEARRQAQAQQQASNNSGTFGALLFGAAVAAAGGNTEQVMGAAMQGAAMTTTNEMSRNIYADAGQQMFDAGTNRAQAEHDATMRRLQAEADARAAQEQAAREAQARKDAKATADANARQQAEAQQLAEQRRLAEQQKAEQKRLADQKAAETKRLAEQRRQEEAKRPVAFKEGVVLCRQQKAKYWRCDGPLQYDYGDIDGPSAQTILRNACGGNLGIHDLGSTGGFRAFGCGFGIHPTARDYPGNRDVPAEFGVYVPDRGTFYCPTSKLAYCRG